MFEHFVPGLCLHSEVCHWSNVIRISQHYHTGTLGCPLDKVGTWVQAVWVCLWIAGPKSRNASLLISTEKLREHPTKDVGYEKTISVVKVVYIYLYCNYNYTLIYICIVCNVHVFVCMCTFVSLLPHPHSHNRLVSNGVGLLSLLSCLPPRVLYRWLPFRVEAQKETNGNYCWEVGKCVDAVSAGERFAVCFFLPNQEQTAYIAMIMIMVPH